MISDCFTSVVIVIVPICDCFSSVTTSASVPVSYTSDIISVSAPVCDCFSYVNISVSVPVCNCFPFVVFVIVSVRDWYSSFVIVVAVGTCDSSTRFMTVSL